MHRGLPRYGKKLVFLMLITCGPLNSSGTRSSSCGWHPTIMGPTHDDMHEFYKLKGLKQDFKLVH
jgi:hypothetical protein